LGSSILARSLPAILLYALGSRGGERGPVHELAKTVHEKAKIPGGRNSLSQGHIADEMFLAGNGKYRVTELDKDIQPGQIFGELALLTPGYRRTRTVQCESGHVDPSL
jgi:hypothetical protein